MQFNIFDQNEPRGSQDGKTNKFANFLLAAGLYDSILISEENIYDLCNLIDGNVRLSAYCTGCKEMRVFSSSPIQFFYEGEGRRELRSLADELRTHQIFQRSSSHTPKTTAAKREWYWSPQQMGKVTRIMTFNFVCAMDNNHHLDYVVRTDGNKMTKIGQFPSVADLSFPEIDDLNKDIDELSRKELRRAIGLYAQGIGVGSFVYLRRIFERILETAKGQAQADGRIDLSGYETKRVAEKMKLLREYLPDMINSSPVIYGIVSKGIHELSEEDCIKYFPVLQESIFMILKQWARKREERQAEKALAASLSKISTEIL